MAKIYEFVIKNQTTTQDNVITEEQIPDGNINFGGSSAINSILQTKKKIKPTISPNPQLKIGGGNRTGVDHDRFQRVYTSIGNKFTGGLYEKSVRGLSATKGAISGNALGWAVLAQMAINIVMSEVIRPLHKQAEERNANDILKIRTGAMSVGNNYDLSVNIFTGRKHYKSNS